MPTTITSTIGTGGDYSTLQAWEDAAPANLVTSDQVWRGECFNQTFAPGGTAITFAGSTSDATRYKELTAAAGASFVDDADARTNALRYNTANGAAIENTTNGYASAISVQEGFVRINRLQISSIRDCVNNGSGDGSLWLNQIIAHTSSTGGSPPVLLGRNNGKITNSLVYRTGSSTTALLSTFQTVTAVNVTLAAASDRTAATNAVTQSYPSSAVFRNVAAFGCTNALNSSSSTTSTTCRTSAASPPSGWSTVAYDTSTGSGFEATTASGFDARLKSTSALIDVGTTDATNAATDIVGFARPGGSSYDVGAWEFGAGGTDYTLTADSGSYALTGQDAGLIAARTLTADQGSYAVTGQTADLIRTVRLLADQGSYALTGQDAALRAARLIGADSGSYSITGQDATLTYAASGVYTLTADSGTYSISGQDATLTYVPLVNYTLTADAGSYAITGQAADLIYTPLNNYVLSAEFGQYSIAGQDAALRYSGAPAVGGFPGFDVRTVDGPRMWWQRKPKRITEEEAEEKLEQVAEVIAEKAKEHATAKKPKKARTAEVVEEIRPMLAEMPGFDWRPMYEAAYQAALDQAIESALRAQEVQLMVAQELERIRRIQDDEDVLLIAAMM